MSKLKMPELNSVIIAGNLTKDPVLRKTASGTHVANFFIAANRKFKDRNGTWRDDVCYVGIVAWHQLADSCEKHLSKGSAIVVEGELQSRNWELEDGGYRSIVEIKAQKIQFLNSGASSKEEFEFFNSDSDETAESYDTEN